MIIGINTSSKNKFSRRWLWAKAVTDRPTTQCELTVDVIINVGTFDSPTPDHRNLHRNSGQIKRDKWCKHYICRVNFIACSTAVGDKGKSPSMSRKEQHQTFSAVSYSKCLRWRFREQWLLGSSQYGNRERRNSKQLDVKLKMKIMQSCTDCIFAELPRSSFTLNSTIQSLRRTSRPARRGTLSAASMSARTREWTTNSLLPSVETEV